MAVEIVEGLSGAEGFDAARFQREAKLSEGGEITDHVKRLVFVKWHMANPRTRKPVEFGQLCGVLHLEAEEGRRWLGQEWLSEWIEKERVGLYRKAMPYIERTIMARAMAGDPKASELVYKVMGKPSGEEGSGAFDDLDKEVVEEGMEISGARDGMKLTKGEKVLATRALQVDEVGN